MPINSIVSLTDTITCRSLTPNVPGLPSERLDVLQRKGVGGMALKRTGRTARPTTHIGKVILANIAIANALEVVIVNLPGQDVTFYDAHGQGYAGQVVMPDTYVLNKQLIAFALWGGTSYTNPIELTFQITLQYPLSYF